MPRKSVDPDPEAAKQFESDIRKNAIQKNPTTTQKPTNADPPPLPKTPNTKAPKKVSIRSQRPSSTVDNVNADEITFLAESDLLLDQEEDKSVDPKSTQEKHDIAENVYRSFKPIVYLLQILGRWPLTSTHCPDGTREFQWNWRRPGAIYYVIVTIIVLYILVVGSWSMMGIMMNLKIGLKGSDSKNKQTMRFQYEKTILHRHLPTFVMLWTSLIHCLIASITLISRRKYMAFYFTFWTRAMPTMHMNAAKGTFRFMMIMILCYVSSILTLVILSVAHIGPSTVAAPQLFGFLMFREYMSPLYHLKKIEVLLNMTTTMPTTTTPAPGVVISNTELITPASKKGFKYELIENSPNVVTTINIVGGIFLLLVFSASKVYLFVFIYICKLLKNAFAQWNARVYASLLKGSKQPQKSETRTTFILLFRDHCLLLDLMDGTDQLFATILESYFVLQIISICMEGYFFIRTARYAENIKDSVEHEYFMRRFDYIPAVIVFVQSFVILMVVCYSAANVGLEAMAGFEVLRRRTLIGRKTNDELYFMLTMFASYTAYKKIELTAGGYFYLNKEFLIGVLSTILSYFIIVYQFKPMLTYEYEDLETNSTLEYKREVLASFLTRVEKNKVYPQ